MDTAIIALNVGGQRFDVARDTLQRLKGSRLSRMFGGEISVTYDDRGALFIDRDGSLFVHVLRFLRDKEAWIPPCERDVLAPLRNEARFFMLDAMERMVNETLFRLEARYDPPVLPINSQVLTCSSNGACEGETSPSASSDSTSVGSSPTCGSCCSGYEHADDDGGCEESEEDIGGSLQDLAELAVDIAGDVGSIVGILAGVMISPFSHEQKAFAQAERVCVI